MRLVYLFFLILNLVLSADVISTTGQIKFDIQMDDQTEMTLNSIGLGIGITPSANLHVNGNTMITNQMFVGGSSGSSNLNVNGTIGYLFETVSSNVILGETSCVLVDSSSNNLTITLPYAGNVTGRKYQIKKISTLNSVQIYGGGNLIDNAAVYTLSSGNLGYLNLISYNGQWYILGQNSGAKSWSPLELSPSLWLDASDTSSITAGPTGNVSEWRDISGNDFHVNQSTANVQPTSGTTTLNGLNVIDWGESTNPKYLGNDGDGTQNWQDIYIVSRYDGGSIFSDYHGLFTGFNVTPPAHNGIGLIADASSLRPQNQWYTEAKWWDDNYLNGSQLSAPYTVLGVTPSIEQPFLTSISTTTNLSSIDGVCIGNDRKNIAPNRGWRGIICEILAFNTKLSEENRKIIEGYLAHKWGLINKLPNDHPFTP